MNLTRRNLLSIASAVGLAPQSALQGIASAAGFVGAAASAIPEEAHNGVKSLASAGSSKLSNKHLAILNKFREAETLIGVRVEFLEGCLRSGRFPASYDCHRSWSMIYKQSMLLQEIEKLRQDMALLNHIRYGTNWEEVADAIAKKLKL
jgi:hypothetical protein